MLGGFLTAGGLMVGALSIGVGILIIVWPRLITYVIGGYLILIGITTILAVLW